MTRRVASSCALALFLGSLAVAVPASPVEAAGACGSSSLSASQLTSVFANPGIGGGAGGGFGGGDYQHVYPLPDGRNLWLFQDMFFSADNDLRDTLGAAAHNAGLVQDGTCWSVVGGPYGNTFVGKSLTQYNQHWFWPLDGDIGHDGKLWIFFAEMRNPRKTGAAYGAAPVGTWVARVDPTSLAVLSFTPAPDAGTRLYGWSVTSDDTWSYMYGHCYRQFINNVNSSAQFDASCMPNTYLARVPKGHFEAAPQYWVAGGWSSNPAAARPLMTRGAANPMDVQRVGDVYVNVTKVGDWWGLYFHIDKAPNPWGPWETHQSIWSLDYVRCGSCGNYHAQVLPWLDPSGKLIVSYSNGGPFNLWQKNAYLYRPGFFTVPVPTYRVDAPVADTGLVPRTPVRALDTRELGMAAVRGGSFVTVNLAGKVAANAVGAVVMVTAVLPGGPGFLTAWPCGAQMPTAAVLNYRLAVTTANAAHVRISPSQQLCVFTMADAHIVVDVAGSYVPTGGVGFHPLDSTRIVGQSGAVPIVGGAETVVAVTGAGGVPSNGVDAVTVTVTVDGTTGKGFLIAWPCGQARPLASSLNYGATDRTSGSVTVPLAANGTLCMYSVVNSTVTVDVLGWWDDDGMRADIAQPYRAHDSRDGALPAAGSVSTVDMAATLPPGTAAAIANIAVVLADAPGHLAVWSCAEESPGTPFGTTVGYPANVTRSIVAAADLSADGDWCVSTSAAAHFVVDVMVTF